MGPGMRPLIKSCRQAVLCAIQLPYGTCMFSLLLTHVPINQDGGRLTDNIFWSIFLNENIIVINYFPLGIVPKGHINKISPVVKKISWCQLGAKPLSKPMKTQLSDAYMRHWAI